MAIAEVIIKIIAYSLLMTASVVWAIDFYNQGRKVLTILWGTSSVLWLMSLILIVSVVIKVGME